MDVENLENEEEFTEKDVEKLGALLDLVASEPYIYANHLELLNLLKRAGPGALDAELHDAKERLSDTFLMGAEFWNEWLDYEIGLQVALRDKDQVDVNERTVQLLELYSRSVVDFLDINLWKRYIEFALANYRKEESGNIEPDLRIFDRSTVESILSNAVAATGNSFPDSHEIWNIYRDMKMSLLTAKPTPEEIDSIKRLYLSRLKIPHANLEQTFSDFSSFITQYDNNNYEKELVAANKLVADTRKLISQYQEHEIAIESNPTNLDAWFSYIETALAKPKKYLDTDYCRTLYERVLKIFYNNPVVWDDYILFLLEHSFAFSIIDGVCSRAVKACPWSGCLWANWIRTRERFGSSTQSISQIRERALATRFLKQNVDDYSLVNCTWLAFLRRKVTNWKDNNSVKYINEELINILEDYDENFGKVQDQNYSLPLLSISIFTFMGQTSSAREIWKKLSKRHSRESEFWIRWFYWETSVCLSTGDILTPASVLADAITHKNLDWPERICDYYTRFERDYGSAFSSEKADIKVKRFMKSVNRRRAEQAVLIQKEYKDQSSADQSSQILGEATDAISVVNGKRKNPATEEIGTAVKKQKQLSSTGRDREHSTVIVQDLPSGISESKIKHFFKDCGPIKSIKIVHEGDTSTATVEFEKSSDTLTAQTRDQKKIDGMVVTVRIGLNTTLWVTNFPSMADENYIRQIFSKYGEIVDIRFPSLSVNNNRRFCYLQYKNQEDAIKAQKELDNTPSPPLKGASGSESVKMLIVKISDPSQKQNRRGAVYEGRELYVRNIPLSAKQVDIEKLFERYGDLERVRLPSKDELFHTHQGFGFVSFKNNEDAKRALELDLTKIGDKILSVTIASSKASHGNYTSSLASRGFSSGSRGSRSGRGAILGRSRGSRNAPRDRLSR
ncbi:hypothetical protein V1511DRAFT_461805 [Dipodascopsis uninucleata]